MNIKYIFNVIQRSYLEITNEKSSVQWLYDETPECIIISFRGTDLSESLWNVDLLRNILSILPWKHKDLGWVSLGYLNGAQHALKDLYRYLESKHHSDKPIIFCGHSMGSAMSYMCAKMMEADGIPVAAWVGTGVTNFTISTQTPKFKCYNFKYEEDIISIFPPKLFGFKQPCPVTQIGKDDSRRKLFRIGDIADHRMVAYLNNAPDLTIL